jgi:hypothetical protein
MWAAVNLARRQPVLRPRRNVTDVVTAIDLNGIAVLGDTSGGAGHLQRMLWSDPQHAGHRLVGRHRGRRQQQDQAKNESSPATIDDHGH